MFTPASTCHTIDRSQLGIDPLESYNDSVNDITDNYHTNITNDDGDDDGDVGDRLDSSSRVLPPPTASTPSVTLMADEMLTYGDLAYQVRLYRISYTNISKVNITTCFYYNRVCICM